jgi:xylulokinase
MVVAAGLSQAAAVALGMGLRPGDIVIDMARSSALTAVTDTPVHDPSGAIVSRCDAGDSYLAFASSGDAVSAIADVEQLMGAPTELLASIALGADDACGGLRFDGDALRGIGGGGLNAPNLARAVLEGVLRDQWRSVAPLAAHGVVARRAVLQGRYARLLADVAATILPMPVEVTVASEFAADGAALQAAWALQGSRPGWVPASALGSDAA